MDVGIYPVNLTWLGDKPQDCVGGLLASVLVSELCRVTTAAQAHVVPRKAILLLLSPKINLFGQYEELNSCNERFEYD